MASKFSKITNPIKRAIRRSRRSNFTERRLFRIYKQDKKNIWLKRS